MLLNHLYCRCTTVYGTPTMFVDLCSEIDQLPPEQHAKLNMPEIAVCGGSLCSPELSTRIKNKLKLQNLVVSSVYECICVVWLSLIHI